MHKITGYIEKDPETGLYVAVVPGIPGAHTQAETLDELQRNLKEVVELCLEEMDTESKKRWHVIDELGKGGQGKVYRVIDASKFNISKEPRLKAGYPGMFS